jgi:hypothetical protein
MIRLIYVNYLPDRDGLAVLGQYDFALARWHFEL